jgi:hypothetical protein
MKRLLCLYNAKQNAYAMPALFDLHELQRQYYPINKTHC